MPFVRTCDSCPETRDYPDEMRAHIAEAHPGNSPEGYSTEFVTMYEALHGGRPARRSIGCPACNEQISRDDDGNWTHPDGSPACANPDRLAG